MIWARWMPLVAVLTASLHLSWLAKPPSAKPDVMNFEAFARLPVQDGGRVKPLDTVARVALTVISSRQRCTDPQGNPVLPIPWLLQAMTMEPGDRKAGFAQYRIFRVDLPQLVQMLGLENRPGSWRYSLAELAPKFDALQIEADRAGELNKKKRTLFDDKVLELHRHLGEFWRIHSWRLAVIPPSPPASSMTPWKTPQELRPDVLIQQAIHVLQQKSIKDGAELKKLPEQELIAMVRKEQQALRDQAPKAVHLFVSILDAYRTGNANAFNEAVDEFRETTSDPVSPKDLARVRIEVFFNRVSPFYLCMIYYVCTFLAVCLGWFTFAGKPQLGETFFRTATALAAWTFAIHSIALLGRMYIMDRPFVFVTNLYSSAVFIGWCGVAMGLFIEWVYGRGIGTAISAVAGGAGLVVAYFLDLGMEGDKFEMMQAVLDTNFWLATHVTTVTFGYAATFVAGFVGVAFIICSVATRLMTPALTKTLSSLIYGTICFATLLSFVGTVLGGIWADYSWGRFWGWDPKENGAMLIVLWNALILHARWAGMVKQLGIAILAVFGNIVTAWSWFGTNQLGVGLHEYGFSSAVATSMVVFDVTMLGVMMLGLMPKRLWWSSQMDLAANKNPNLATSSAR